MKPRIFLAMLLPLLHLTACRFGNRVEYAPQPETLKGKSGYYESAPQSLKFCAITEDAHCAETNLEQIPTVLSSIMTNPVAFVVLDESTGDARLLAPGSDGSSALPIYVEMSDTVSLSGAWEAATFWKDENCQSQMYLIEEGKLTRASSASSSGGLPISGRLSLTIQMILELQGSCEAELTKVRDCHESASACGEASADENTASHDAVVEMFRPYVDNGALKTADIPSVKAIAYVVSYE